MSDVIEITKEKKRTLVEVILSSGFLAAFSTALVLYINSSYLEMLIPKDWVGMMYTVAYIITFIFIQSYGKLISRFSNYSVTLSALLLEVICLVLLAMNIHTWLSLIAFVVFVVLYNAVVINFDLFLEQISTASDTGRIRGLFWTAANLGIMLGPFLSGILTGMYGFAAAYYAAALMLIPSILLLFFTYRESGKTHFKKHHPLWKTIKRVHRDRDLRGIYLIALALFGFYSWMVIYTPIYLLEQNFSWEQIGVMFTVMLIPFVIIEYPAGWLADKYLGETELLTLGFAIMGISVIALLSVSTFVGFMIVLFSSRVGAALVEIMRDVYFYKKVDQDELDLIDLFRNMRSVAYAGGPAIASGVLALGYGIPTLYVLLALIMFASTLIPFFIKDTL